MCVILLTKINFKDSDFMEVNNSNPISSAYHSAPNTQDKGLDPVDVKTETIVNKTLALKRDCDSFVAQAKTLKDRLEYLKGSNRSWSNLPIIGAIFKYITSWVNHKEIFNTRLELGRYESLLPIMEKERAQLQTQKSVEEKG
jgi:hypothetical protein